MEFFNVDTSTGDSQSGDPFKSTSKAWFPGLGHRGLGLQAAASQRPTPEVALTHKVFQKGG